MDDPIAAYIAAAPPGRQARLTALHDLITSIAPDATSGIEWKMPVFRRGAAWVAIANQKSYLSVYLGTEARAAAVVASDPALKGGKACVNIPDRAALPLAALAPALRAALS